MLTGKNPCYRKHRVKKISLKKTLCQNFCAYNRPDKKEDLACMGFLVVEKLIKKGREIPFHKTDKKFKAHTEEKLTKTICVVCPFHESDCDFVRKKKDAPPCGGFMLLGNLLEKNIISIDDMQNII